MAITFVAAGTYLTEGSGASATFGKPAGVQADDIVLVFLYKETTAAVTAPSGFTEIGHQATTTSQDSDSYVYWKRAGGSEPSDYTFSWTGADWRTGFAVAFRGCVATGSPVDVYDGDTTGTSTSTTTPAVQVTTTGADRMLAWFGSTWNTRTWTGPAGLTAFAPGGQPSTRLLQGGYATQASAGTSSAYQGSTGAGSDAKTAHLIALTPASGGGGSATFGKTTDGASNSASSANRVWVSTATPASTGTVTGGTARIWLSASGTTDTRMAIYADSSGSPGALLAQSDVLTVTATTEADRNFTFSGADQITVTSGTPYWIGVAWNDPGTPSLTVSRDNTATSRYEQTATSGPTLPNPFGTPTANNTGPIDAYITYTTGTTVTGTAAVDLAALGVTAVGVPSKPGTAAVALGGLGVTAAGTSTPGVSGTAAITLGGLSVTAAGTSTPEPAGTVSVFATSFETGDFTPFESCQWTGRNDDCQTYDGTSDYSAQVVALDGRPHVARFEVRDGDIPPFGGSERAEVAEAPGAAVFEGDEVWFALDVKFPSDFPTPVSGWFMIAQLHPSGDFSPTVTLSVDTDDALYLTNNEPTSEPEYTEIGPIVRGSWVRYVVHFKAETTSATGWGEVYQDGAVVLAQHPRATVLDANEHYWKWGTYRSTNHTATSIVYLDNLRITAAGPVIDGSAVLALGGPTITTTGTRVVSGASALALSGPSVAAVGTVTPEVVTGTATVALEGPNVTAAGTRGTAGTGLVALPGLSVIVIGTVIAEVVTGSASVALVGPSVTAVGRRATPGTGQVALAGPSVIALGTVIAEVVTGSASVALGVLSVAAVGKRTVLATVDVPLGGLTLLGLGDGASPPVTGTGAVSLGAVSVTAAGTVIAQVVTGTAHVAIAGLVITGVGSRAVTGTAAVTLPQLILLAVGAAPSENPPWAPGNPTSASGPRVAVPVVLDGPRAGAPFRT